MGRMVAIALAVLSLAGCYGAQQTRPDDPVGAGNLKPTVEDKDAGLVGMTPGFNPRAYPVLAVAPFQVTDPAIKDEGDRRLAASMATVLQSEIVRHMRESGLFSRVVNLAETTMPQGKDKVLRLDGAITRLGEGSQAVRAMFGLYGAGRTRTQVETRFTDAATGQVVLVTADRRIASMGFFGGDSKDHLKESYDDIARDLKRFLTRVAQGEGPKP